MKVSWILLAVIAVIAASITVRYFLAPVEVADQSIGKTAEKFEKNGVLRYPIHPDTEALPSFSLPWEGDLKTDI